MPENPVTNLLKLWEGIKLFYRKSNKFTWKNFIQIIERAVMNGVISGPCFVRSKTKKTQNSTEASFPFLIRMKTLMTAIVEDGENADPE